MLKILVALLLGAGILVGSGTAIQPQPDQFGAGSGPAGAPARLTP